MTLFRRRSTPPAPPPSDVSTTSVKVEMTSASARIESASSSRVSEQVSARSELTATATEASAGTAREAPGVGSAGQGGVAFLTDVEGNWEYFKAFVDRSEALSFVGGQPHYMQDGSVELVLHDGWRFVHGGDACDKGGAVGGTVRVVRTLVALKRKYPDRVTLILGNRDLNKMRWTAQLAFEPNSFVPETGFAMWAEWNALHRVDGPCWVADAEKRAGMTPAAYYRKMIAKAKGCAASDVSEADVSQFDTVANRIRWHFKVTTWDGTARLSASAAGGRTLRAPACATASMMVCLRRCSRQEMMGADGEFERRRAELTLLSEIQRGRDSAVEATEADVVCSTVESVQAGGTSPSPEPRTLVACDAIRRVLKRHPRVRPRSSCVRVPRRPVRVAAACAGFMREYLELGQLAHIHANCLYMHGGIVGGGCAEGEHAVGALPQADAREDDVHEWVRRLNDWKSAQIGEWIREPNWSGRRDGGGSSGGESVGGGGGGGGTPWRTLDGYVLHGGGQELQDYGLFTDNGPTVVLGRHLQKTGMPVRATSCGLLNSVLLLDLS
jgi:hypothetical protein